MALDSFQENVTYFRLFICCPVCLEQGSQMMQSYWKHLDNNCNGDIYVGDNAYCKCLKCGRTSHVRNWKYLCPSHTNSIDTFMTDSDALVCADSEYVVMAVSMSGQMAQETGVQWLQRFFRNMGEDV